MNTEHERAQLAMQIGDIAESAYGAKGAVFADVVNALYALDGMRDLGHRLVDALPEAKAYLGALDVMHGTVQQHILSPLAEADRGEARNLATKMFERQRSLHERISRSA